MDKRPFPFDFFHIQGQCALITGGSGAIGSALARGLAQAGARVVIVSRRVEACIRIADEIRAAGGQALGIGGDVLDRGALERVARDVRSAFGPVNILINAAGGNAPQATTGPDLSFFDLEGQMVDAVFRTNFAGVFQSCQVFGQHMVEQGQGCIVNIASMSALRPLTRVVAYSAAKAAVVNFTQWLAVYMAQEYSPRIRVNALAPGFLLTAQNRFLLVDPASGAWTPRGEAIIAHVPMRRLAMPEELVGTLLWLVSPASDYVTGTVVPVDGGFSAYCGV
jgi:NAD(P)-dependent dehydrogenase (short-subunit alcohol dehydrogenase family)